MSPSATAKPQPPTHPGKLDACALLTSAEIKRAQGEEVKSVRPSEQQAGGFRLLQCLYLTPTFSNSVSLAVAVPDASSGDGARRYWTQRFHSSTAREDERRKGGDREDGEEARPPLKVSGVGEEAFWVGNARAGSLYVLSGQRFFRISLGGKDATEQKLRNTTGLARTVLGRAAAQ